VEKAPAADVLPTNGSIHVAYTLSSYAAMLDKALTVHHRGLIDDRTGWHNRPSSSQVPTSLHDLCPFKPLRGIMDVMLAIYEYSYRPVTNSVMLCSGRCCMGMERWSASNPRIDKI
jgi:hypothetical protein